MSLTSTIERDDNKKPFITIDESLKLLMTKIGKIPLWVEKELVVIFEEA